MLTNALKDRGFAKNWLDFPKLNLPWFATFGLILIAYVLCFWIRLEWIDFAQASYLDERGKGFICDPIWSKTEWRYQTRTTLFILEASFKKQP